MNCSESGAGSAAQEAKPDPNEIASEMNEQEHESERSCRPINYASETSDGNPGSPCTTLINMPGEGHSGYIESGSPGDTIRTPCSWLLTSSLLKIMGLQHRVCLLAGMTLLGVLVEAHYRSHSFKFQHPSHRWLENFEQQMYQKYRRCCLADRKKVGIGCSKEDAATNYLYGLQCLFTFYSDGLEQKFRDDLYNDLEKLTLDFYEKGDLYGLEKYWAFHHLRETRDHKQPMKKRAELERLLKKEFCTLDDFHRAKPKPEKKEPVQLTAIAEQ